MKNIIFDCDNTMGIEGCDVDDGLALLYLLGKKNVSILGISTTYGNSDIETVFSNTQRILKELGRDNIPLFKGSPSKQVKISEAASFIAETVNTHPGNISILATGSLTNIYDAYLLDNTLFEKISEIVLMGGITEPLVINDKLMDELNFACDPVAAECVLKNGKNISVLTGNNCLTTFFSEKEFSRTLLSSQNPIAKYIIHNTKYWFKDMMDNFNIDGFHNWDLVAAAFIAEPSLFKHKFQNTIIDPEKLEKGFLTVDISQQKNATLYNLNYPTIINMPLFCEDVYKTWLNVEMNH